MNILIFLFLGFLIGRIFKKKGKKLSLEVPIAIVLLLMVFLLGVKVGEVKVSAFWILAVSVIFSIATTLGSLLMVMLA